MAKQIIRVKIDVSKIDKARLFKGEKGLYLDATLFLNDEVDQYGNNGFIVQDVKKEEREAGVKGAILGNTKPVGQAKAATPAPAAKVATPASDNFDDLPF